MPRKTPTFDKRTAAAIQSHRTRALAAGQIIDYSLDELRRLVADAQQLPCPYCRRRLTDAGFSVDHSTPTSRGGSFALWNLQVTCKQCNLTKGALTHEEFSSLWVVALSWQSAGRLDLMSRLRAGGAARGRSR